MKTTKFNSRSGFTLIEVIAVLVLLGILTAIAIPKYIDLSEAAKERAFDAAVAELNGREALAWGKTMLELDGADTFDDAAVLEIVFNGESPGDHTLGKDYHWEGE